MAEERQVRTGDGRTLRVVSDGRPDGIAILMQHGTPCGGSLFAPHVDDARAHGIRLLGYDRPGYGGSSPQRGRTVADCARDVEAIADAFGLARLAVWGWSGGGPHALACGALLPNRVAAVACLGSVAPGDAEGLDWFAGFGNDNVAEFGKALRGRRELAAYLAPKREARLAGTAEQLHDGLRTLMTAIDTAALTGDFAEFLHRSMTGALENGVEGWIDDDLAFMAPWGFELSDVVVPVLLWHGEHDGFVPAAHGRWLAERLPHREAHLSREDGHLTLVTKRVPSVHAWLAAQFQP